MPPNQGLLRHKLDFNMSSKAQETSRRWSRKSIKEDGMEWDRKSIVFACDITIVSTLEDYWPKICRRLALSISRHGGCEKGPWNPLPRTSRQIWEEVGRGSWGPSCPWISIEILWLQREGEIFSSVTSPGEVESPQWILYTSCKKQR